MQLGRSPAAQPGPTNDLRKVDTMAKCDACGNDYDKSFQITMQGKHYVFDSFECAIHTLAPICSHCAVRIIGHGLESHGRIFCCDHCATKSGVTELRDRV